MSKQDYVQFNNQNYRVDIKLVNEEMDLRIPAGIIKDLVITDSIYSPFCHAILSINSTGNALDNLVVQQIDKARSGVANVSYAFNSDSRDMFYISMVPVDTDATEFEKDVWGFNFDSEYAMPFIIYDEEEVVTTRGQVKTKVFYLKQLSEQMLEERKFQWSSANVVSDDRANKINLGHASNDARKAYTGDCIQHLIGNGIPRYVSFADDWDRGGSKIFYAAGPQESPFDVLEYILDKHISSTNDDFCIFGEDRNGDMFLRSMTDIYKKAYREEMQKLGDFFIDAFSSSSGTLDTATMNDVSRTVPSAVYGFSMAESNKLEGLVNFSYLNMANMDSMDQLVTTMVHSYASGDKQFSIDCKDSHIANIKKIFHKQYTSKMRGESPVTILPINLSKVNNECVNHQFGSGDTKQDRLYAGVNRVLRQTFAFSPSVTFDAKGSTARRSARFIIMNANHANTDSPFAKIFIGEWLTTKVVHYFSFLKGEYINSISCVKPHASHNLSIAGLESGMESWYDQMVSEFKVEETEETNAS